jgi:hypothetical protein
MSTGLECLGAIILVIRGLPAGDGGETDMV